MAVTDAETEATDEFGVHPAFALHFAMSVCLDALSQVVDGAVINFHCCLEHHMVNAMMLAIKVLIDEDDHANLILTMVVQQQTEKFCVQGGGFRIKPRCKHKQRVFLFFCHTRIDECHLQVWLRFHAVMEHAKVLIDLLVYELCLGLIEEGCGIPFSDASIYYESLGLRV